MARTRTVALVLLPLVIMIGGVPLFDGDTRIGPLPSLASWFLLWVLVTPAFVLAADRLARTDRDGE